ncbi:related to bifunctional polynucleotide phosphatase/kinase [Cephalotrichum gorgonifer]|uniref:Related to bifunctional polynucleotide phosphatase/kinase n=1 Tax=Cephalotrichum gorgonifer TaxID=2041049 RepID=A0AAE8SY74_9PEZI|nr:related to bifunctional polynucleotide phosphatase/kinase [Cephalotrichum gorgonifer]
MASKRGPNAPISPPPVKRRLHSGTTKSAVANFFTPASQKPKDKTVWTERAPNEDTPATLLVGRYQPEAKEDGPTVKRRKIAAFDLDSTLIVTLSKKKFPDSATDWKWWHSSVVTKLKSLYGEDGYRVVIVSNQAGLTLHPDPKAKTPKAQLTTRVSAFKQKCSALFEQLDFPISIYAATEKDIFRKPRPGIWREILDDYDLQSGEVDMDNSFYVGDAGGRKLEVKGGDGSVVAAKDFSCSDRNFAHNVGLKFLTPEEHFLGLQPRDFHRDFDLEHFPFDDTLSTAAAPPIFERKSAQELVVFCGSPGSGKSTFYEKYLKPLDYERINQDNLKTRDKCVQAARGLLEEGSSVVIDNTNADPETRAIWIGLAKKYNIPARCVWFRTPKHICEHNDAVRALNKPMNPENRQGLPTMALTGFAARFKEPKEKEGFEDIVPLDFVFRGTKEEHDIWARYWL